MATEGDIQRRVVKQLKPDYQTAIKRGKGSDEAYAAIYEKAVDAVAKTLKVSKEKTKFESRHLLQAIMNEVAR